jgi:hypothetical protein
LNADDPRSQGRQGRNTCDVAQTLVNRATSPKSPRSHDVNRIEVEI